MQLWIETEDRGSRNEENEDYCQQFHTPAFRGFQAERWCSTGRILDWRTQYLQKLKQWKLKQLSVYLRESSSEDGLTPRHGMICINIFFFASPVHYVTVWRRPFLIYNFEILIVYIYIMCSQCCVRGKRYDTVMRRKLLDKTRGSSNISFQRLLTLPCASPGSVIPQQRQVSDCELLLVEKKKAFNPDSEAEGRALTAFKSTGISHCRAGERKRKKKKRIRNEK